MDTKIKVQDVKGQIDKRNIYMLFGCYCNNPRAMLRSESETIEYDYPELFHNMIFKAMLNIVHKGNIEKITPIEIENEISQFPKALEYWKLNKGYDYIENAIQDTKDLVSNIVFYRDVVRKYSILRFATKELKIDLTFMYDENDEEILSKFNAMTSSDVMSTINDKIISFREIWKDDYNDNESFVIGENLDELILEYQTRQTSYGYPFQSRNLTRIFGGYKPQKYYLISSKTGGGKSRFAMADACNIASAGYYDWNKKKWKSTGEQRPVLYISIELDKEEIQLCALGHISGINPKKIENNLLNKEEREILRISTNILKNSNWYCEYLPEFDPDDITDKISEYVLKYHVEYVFFDYINESQKLYQYCYKKTHNKLRTDQVLFELSSKLKLLAKKYNISMYSSTQLTREDDTNNKNKIWNTKSEADIKGSKAVTEKIDYGAIIMPISDKESKALEPIINELKTQNFNFKEPNYVYNVYKARGSDYTMVRVWINLDLGCIRVQDCFVTDYYGNLIQLPNVEIFDFGELNVEKLN